MNETLLNSQSRYLVAVSYGPDSMALLHMMTERGYRVAVAHVNYHKRDHSNLEQTGLEQFCLGRDLPLYILDIQSEHPKGNFQTWARRVRYRFFAEIARKIKAEAVVVAHHRDDNLETILIQHLRKTMAICSGIAPISVVNRTKIIRPLLDYSKRQLLDYCLSNGVGYAIDESNLGDLYTRNRIRHQLLPTLSEAEITTLLDEARFHNETMDARLTELRDQVHDGTFKAETAAVSDETTIFLLLHLLLKEKLPEFPISRHLIQEVKTVASTPRSQWHRHLWGRYELTRSYDFFKLTHLEKPAAYSFTYDCPSKDDNPYFFMDFTEGSHHDLIKMSDYPITIRNSRPGDKTAVDGHERPVRRLFIDWKLPHDRRATWPVVVDRQGVIKFVPRYRSDFHPDANPRFYVK
jgi:tRNA(Ile)-lysidine synthase